VTTTRIGASLLLLAFSACSEGAPAEVAGVDGKRVYDAQGCALCHSSDATGTKLGPTLHGKASHWTRENLVLYFKAPVEYAAKDPRLAEQKKKFPTMPMPPFAKLSEEELGALADHVLGLP
jgi:mono/diheme cytochrome c family protein